MEMERINDNTIRVSIESGDLEERGITFLDLLGNQKQIETFFYSILEEVDVDDQFEETDSVTFQVLPKKDGLELFISKNLPLDEIKSFNIPEEQTIRNNFSDFLKDQIGSSTKGNDDIADEELEMVKDVQHTVDVVFKLEDFEAVINLANSLNIINVLTNLYKFKGDFYLSVTFLAEEVIEMQIQNDISLLYEYANRTNVNIDILEEYGETLMELNALELVRFYFN